MHTSKKPKLIAITGGIGSGKSLVCRVFATLGTPVYEADSRSKSLVCQDATLKTAIVNLLGPEAYLPTGEYNRPWVAQQVFQDSALLAQLNALIHPRVQADTQEWVLAHGEATFLIYEAALVRGGDSRFAEVILVTAPLELRLKRTLARDTQRSETDIRSIMARQTPEEEWRKTVNGLIVNDDTQMLLPQVLALHQRLGR